MAQWVLASDGRPFTDRDAATIKRDLLSRELGSAVKFDVVQHPAGGYAVTCSPPGEVHNGTSFDPLDAASTGMHEDFFLRSLESSGGATARREPRVAPSKSSTVEAHTANLQQSTARRYPDAFRLSPAARAFLSQHVLALLGVYFLFQPHVFLRLVRVGVPENPQLAALGLGAVMLGSVVLALVSVSRFLWTYTANTYVIDHTGVMQVQWYFERGRLRRRAPRVNFAHLRTANVDQSLVQLILDVGTLRLASGATDTYEVELRNVCSPRRLQAEFQRRLREATAPAGVQRRDADL